VLESNQNKLKFNVYAMDKVHYQNNEIRVNRPLAVNKFSYFENPDYTSE